MHDRDLLQQFITHRDEQAFAELVARHVGLVHAAASRQVKDPGIADDVTQSVFVLLAQQARRVRNPNTLASWLLVTTRYVALNALRARNRRQIHERESATMKQEADSSDPSNWQTIAPLLDEAMAQLKPDDRDAVTLRYFQDQSVADVATALRVSEDAAKKRVQRAIERLRAWFAQRGVVTTADALASALAVNVVGEAPGQLAAHIAHAALSAPASAAATKGAVVIMAMSNTAKVVIGVSIAAAVVVGTVTPVVLYWSVKSDGAVTMPSAAKVESDAVSDDWRTRFDAVYFLEPGQNLKRILPPYIPERQQFFASGPGMSMFAAGKPAFRVAITDIEASLLRWDGTSAKQYHTFHRQFDVGDLLKAVPKIWPQDTVIDRGLIAEQVRGDWIVRDDVTEEQLAAATIDSIREIVGKGVVLKREPMEREVIVVAGKLEYTEPLREKELFPTIHLHGGPNRPRVAFNMSVGQTAQEWLQIVGEAMGRPMVIEADLGAPKAAAIAMYEIANARRAPEILDAAIVDELLADVTRQTSLHFMRQQRTVPTWRLAPADK